MCLPHKDHSIVLSETPPICRHCANAIVEVETPAINPRLIHHRTRATSKMNTVSCPAISSTSDSPIVINDDNIDDIYDHINSQASHIEDTLGLKSCELDWKLLPNETTEELTCCSRWPVSDESYGHEIIYSKHLNVVRITTILPTKATIRYITPFNTWSYTSSLNGTNINFINIEPVEITSLPILATTFAQIQGAKYHASVRIIIQLLLDSFFPPRKAGISSSSIDEVKHNYLPDDSPGIAAYTGKGRAHDSNPEACCPGCHTHIRDNPACNGIYTFKVCPFYKIITVFCKNKNSRRTRPIRGDDLSNLFGLNMGNKIISKPALIIPPPRTLMTRTMIMIFILRTLI
jgi:hypothetical protein